MAKKETNEVEGKVWESLPNATFKVELANGHEVLAYLSGKIRIYFQHVLGVADLCEEIKLIIPYIKSC